MKWAIIPLAVFGLCLATPTVRAEETPQSHFLNIVPCQTHDEKAETRAAKVAEKLQKAFVKADVSAIRALAPEMEKVMGEAPFPPYYAEKCDTRLIIYSDNLPSQLVLGVLFETATEKKANPDGKKLEVVAKPASPFALISYGLAWVYADRKDYGRCVTILTDGRQRDPWNEAILSEYLFCLAQSGQNAESLAEAEKALENPFFNLTDYTRAKVLRHKGYALVELQKWDEAESAYKDSLKFDGSSQLAKNEILYIQQMRAQQSKP